MTVVVADTGTMPKPPIHPSWARAVAEWTDALRAADQSPRTIKLRRHQLRQVATGLAPSGPWDVTGDDLVHLAASKSWGTEARRSWRSGVRGFYRWAMRTGRTDSDPSEALAPVRPLPPMPRPVPTPVVRDALDDATPRVRMMIRLAGECGLRREEVAKVHSADVMQLDDGWCLIVHGKGRRERVVPIVDDLARAIREQGGWAFPGRIDGHLSADWVGDLLAEALPDEWTGHKLRHRAAATWYAVDHDLRTVQAMLGHASLATTEHYVPPSMERARALVHAARLTAGPPSRGRPASRLSDAA